MIEKAQENTNNISKQKESEQINNNKSNVDMKKLLLPFEIKEINNDDEKYYYIRGYASTFNNTDRGGDIVVRGAFLDALKEKQRFPLLWQHDTREPIGSFTGMEDEKGFFIEARLPKGDSLVDGRVMKQVEIGSIGAFSIGYSVLESDYAKTGERLLKKIQLWETSLVTIPMNPEAVITGFKSFMDIIEVKEEEKTEMINDELGLPKEPEVEEKNIEQFDCMKDFEAFLKEPRSLNTEERKIFISKLKEFSKKRDVEEEAEKRDAEAIEMKDFISNSLNNFIKKIQEK